MLKRLRHRTRPALLLWIIAMWCLLMGEITWANVAGGLGVGLLVAVGLPLPAMPNAGLKVHCGRLAVFLCGWFWSLLKASAKLAYLALRPQEPPKTAIVHAPMRVANELTLYFATAAFNLQPGGSVTDIDLANRRCTLHILGVDTEEDLRRELEAFARLERDMLRIFEGAK